jgi:hypothetical protein
MKIYNASTLAKGGCLNYGYTKPIITVENIKDNMALNS